MALAFVGLISIPIICGPGVWLKESKAKDVDELDTLLRVHRLCVLNSWCTSRPQITFEFGSIKSQLDLVITRRGNVTAISREATSLRDTQLAAWREGAKHFPVFAMIKVSWQPWWRQTQQKWGPQPNVLAMACAFSQSAPSEALTKFRNQVQASIPDKCTIDDINPVLLKAACDHFPKNKEARTHRIEDQTLVEGVSVMWKLFRQMRKQDRSIRGMWNAWKAWARFHRAYKAHKKRCQALKKAWRMDALQRVEEAAHRGDSYAVHKIVRQLAPKVARVTMQLRRDGQMLNPKQELEWLCEFFTDRFRSQEAPTSDQHTLSQPFSVSLESVERAISLIPLRKSVPRGVAPGVAWRAVADIVTPIIQREIEQLWRGGTIRVPQGWADACLFLLHKPGTTGKEPKHWRPIGLQDPVGKAIIDLVASRAKPWIVHWLKQVPQFAYLPNRSTGMALRRVFNHCNRIHAKCRALNPSIHDRKHGARPQACFGGLQVCLDLSAAFDLVPRSRIKQALDAAHVPGDVTAVLLQWLEQACYHLEHAGESRNIHPNRGVRQGCKASPILWAAFTGLVALQMDIDIRQSFAKDHLTLFADDHHLAFEFNTEQELYQAIDDVNKVLGYIQEGEPLTLDLPNRKASIYTSSHFYLDDYPNAPEPVSDAPLPHTTLNPAAAFETADEGYDGVPFPRPPREFTRPSFLPDSDDVGMDPGQALRNDGLNPPRPPTLGGRLRESGIQAAETVIAGAAAGAAAATRSWPCEAAATGWTEL